MDETTESFKMPRAKYEAESDLVFNVLFMYIDLLTGYEYSKDKIKFDKNEVTFKGFDMEDEIEKSYSHCCSYILNDFYKDDKRFDIIRRNTSDECYHSHAPILPYYMQLLKVYNKYKMLFPLPISYIEKILDLKKDQESNQNIDI